jgi:predicted transposase/invertase (TIGR01784 family)
MLEKDPLIIKPTSDIFIVSLLSEPKNEPLLRSMINAVLKDKSGRELIKTARVTNRSNIIEHVLEKQIALDVRVEDEQKRAFHIEIQTYPHCAFRERILYGWADTYALRLPAGEDYAHLKPVITIVIAEFDVCPQSGQIHLIFELRERDHHDWVFSDHIQIHVWQLRKVIQGHTKVLEDVTPDLAHWSQFFAFGHEKSEVEMAALTDNDPRVIEAHRELQRFTADPETRELARQRKLFLLDYHLSMNASKEEGEARGEARGIVKGRAEGRAEVARNSVLTVLRKRFTNIPDEMEQAIRQMNDPIALDSLLSLALDCRTLDEFATALK